MNDLLPFKSTNQRKKINYSMKFIYQKERERYPSYHYINFAPFFFLREPRVEKKILGNSQHFLWFRGKRILSIFCVSSQQYPSNLKSIIDCILSMHYIFWIPYNYTYCSSILNNSFLFSLQKKPSQTNLIFLYTLSIFLIIDWHFILNGS